MDSIIWAGAVLNENPGGYYSAADVFCLVSEKEGRPHVVPESMACGTPVVASATSGVPEIIASENLRLPVEDRRFEAFAEAIGRALKKDRKAIAGYARSQSWEKVAGRLAEQLREVLARENPEGGNEIPIEFAGGSIQ